jgi:hypothetical protein
MLVRKVRVDEFLARLKNVGFAIPVEVLEPFLDKFADDCLQDNFYSSRECLTEAEDLQQLLNAPVWGTVFSLMDVLSEEEEFVKQLNSIAFDDVKTWAVGNSELVTKWLGSGITYDTSAVTSFVAREIMNNAPTKMQSGEIAVIVE